MNVVLLLKALHGTTFFVVLICRFKYKTWWTSYVAPLTEPRVPIKDVKCGQIMTPGYPDDALKS